MSSHDDRIVSLNRRQLLTQAEVAELFAVTPRIVRRWASAGELTPIRIGGVTRYRDDEVLSVSNPTTRNGAPAGNGTPSEYSAMAGPTNGSYPGYELPAEIAGG